MCGRVIQSSGPLGYAILEGMHVRDSRVHNYPSEAQSRSEEGIVLLSFSLDRTGHVLAHRIARSSGFADLDNEVDGDDHAGGAAAGFPAEHAATATRSDRTDPLLAALRAGNDPGVNALGEGDAVLYPSSSL